MRRARVPNRKVDMLPLPAIPLEQRDRLHGVLQELVEAPTIPAVRLPTPEAPARPVPRLRRRAAHVPRDVQPRDSAHEGAVRLRARGDAGGGERGDERARARQEEDDEHVWVAGLGVAEHALREGVEGGGVLEEGVALGEQGAELVAGEPAGLQRAGRGRGGGEVDGAGWLGGGGEGEVEGRGEVGGGGVEDGADSAEGDGGGGAEGGEEGEEEGGVGGVALD